MTEDEVMKRVEDIRLEAADDEMAHTREDGLWEDVLREIARGIPGADASALARAALKTTEIRFRRWCA